MQETKTPKLLRYVAYTSLVLASIILFTIIYWLLKPYNPIEFKGKEFKIDTPVVEQGGYLTYTVEYCKSNELIPVVSTSFVDGIIYQTPNNPQPFYGNDCEPKSFLVYIPKALPAGKYYLDHVFTFKVNPIREIRVEAKTEMFEVIEN
jgi:hypothetical protein